MLIGQKIAKLRTQANLTQEQLAEKLYISRELISKWETGKRRPDYKTVLKIAEIFSVKPEDIINRNDVIFNELSGFVPESYNNGSGTLTAALNDFLSKINERDRSIFIRRYYFMEDIAVIADEYDVKESCVRTILMRTRKKLRKYFKEI